MMINCNDLPRTANVPTDFLLARGSLSVMQVLSTGVASRERRMEGWLKRMMEKAAEAEAEEAEAAVAAEAEERRREKARVEDLVDAYKTLEKTAGLAQRVRRSNAQRRRRLESGSSF